MSPPRNRFTFLRTSCSHGRGLLPSVVVDIDMNKRAINIRSKQVSMLRVEFALDIGKLCTGEVPRWYSSQSKNDFISEKSF